VGAERAIFAMELCMALEPDGRLHAGLRGLVKNTPQAAGLHDKWQAYQQAGWLLLQHQHTWFSGCWDYFDETRKAKTDFDMWVNGLLTEEGGRKQPSGAPDPYRGAPRCMTFTIALLLAGGTATSRQMANVCNVPQSHLWKKETFAHLLRGLGYLSFAEVAADTMYLLPNEPGFGLTHDDLNESKFDYLRPIV